jgi:hypothetical protein
MPLTAQPLYLVSAGAFLPGPPIGNDELDRFIVPINRFSSRIKNRILEENGIRTRHYGIDDTVASRFSTAGMAAHRQRFLAGGQLPAARRNHRHLRGHHPGRSGALFLVNNKHPLVPLSTLRAGHRLVLHGLATEVLHTALARKREGREPGAPTACPA